MLIFSAFWLNAYLSILYVSCISAALYFILVKNQTNNDHKYIISPRTLVAIISVATIWIFLSGINGYWYQAGDFPLHDNVKLEDFSARNAIYRDLINYSWPVFYKEQNLALNYYFGFWLPPALITKFCSLFISKDLFTIGINILALWTILGVVIFISLLFYISKPRNTLLKTITLILPIFFSGLDIVGAIYFGRYHSLHIEWWTHIAQYSSLTTLLFWVFNQSIIPWIGTLLFFYERKLSNIGLLFVCISFCGPLSSIGYCIIVLIWLYAELHREYQHSGSIKKIISQACSYQNFITLPFLPLLYYFFTANNFVKNHSTLSFVSWDILDYINFCSIEFALYIVLIFKFFKKDAIFTAVIFSLFCICCCEFKNAPDFQMRASIPAIVLLMVYISKYINSIKNIDYRELLLIILLIVGSITPIYEIKRGYLHLIQTNNISHRDDVFVTLGNKNHKTFPFYNYLLFEPQKTFFYKYFSKEPK